MNHSAWISYRNSNHVISNVTGSHIMILEVTWPEVMQLEIQDGCQSLHLHMGLKMAPNN